jgi:hypothetical protein
MPFVCELIVDYKSLATATLKLVNVLYEFSDRIAKFQHGVAKSQKL